MGNVEDASGTPAPELVDLSDERQVRSRNKKLKAKEEIRSRLLTEIFQRREMRDWAYELLSACHLYAPSHIPGDPYSTAFRDGERNIGLRLLAAIPTDIYAMMLKEAKETDNA